jgi:hypothetical protein
VARNPRRNALFGVLPEICSLQGLDGGDSWAQTGDPPPSHRTGLRPAPGTEISSAETGRQTPAHHLAETDSETPEAIKPRFPRTNCEIACEALNSKSGWWCAQSGANRSPLRDSLLSGNLTGKFAILGGSSTNRPRITASIQVLDVDFPIQANRDFYPTEQGTSMREQRILARRP